MKPALIIKLEFLSLLALTIFGYWYFNYAWWPFFVFLLLPDILMLGYMINPKVGSLVYNLGHTLSIPTLIFMIFILQGNRLMIQIALIWMAHICADRFLGFGLKYPSDFKDTTIQRL
ncbi:DUF4260 domain-containing protein [Fundicoccus culcitae]|uniref:DUF4260 domain-containing protein n=1 Tax=Fundicoccus culcitae TaxID=2969821 RepID=A0ABY5P583_9LACT|nr:DUF4260 domain-containing protein [Fundicoccus culcitae]UUX33736.1 DUF4260 domain-containing protein [Fundicoccus culcitae]